MEAVFVSDCDLRVLPGGKWKLLAPLVVHVSNNFVLERIIVVPEGFLTDLASVPRIPLAFMLAGGKGRKSAVVHDWLCAVGEEREYSDNVFHALLLGEEGKFTADLMWAGVRVGGASRYAHREPPSTDYL